MAPENALRFLAQIAIEYAQGFKDRPATQESVLIQIKAAHDTLNAALQHIVRGVGDGDHSD